jgi:hypothetical protein
VPTAPQPELADFDDVKETDWFYPDVMWAYAEKLMIGVAPRAFAPYQTVNSAMVSMTLTRMLGIDLSGYDSGDGKWFTAAHAWMNDKGFFEGTGVLEAEPPLNRGQLSVVLARLMSSTELQTIVTAQSAADGAQAAASGALDAAIGAQAATDIAQTTTATEPNATSEDIHISDRDLMTDEEHEAFKLLGKLGIIKGKGEGRMDPQGIFIRAELAAILHRISAYIARTS